mmetsp:Transcript_120859/g.189573  ORF Transcript_120859/g.189573 Transcript_120859/m.189573 type:complete len:652 (-) Transcript_120859:31-1986(-)
MFSSRIVISFVSLLALDYVTLPAHGYSAWVDPSEEMQADNFGEGFLSKNSFKAELVHAVGSMLGCGGQPDKDHVNAVKAILTPMWRTLPKTSGRVDRRTLRYLVHRYFMKSSSMMVRGFEPSRATNESDWGAADVLSQMVPAYVESVLESKHKSEKGFTLQDAVDMVLTLDQLIFDAESRNLEDAYAMMAPDFAACHDTPGFVDEKGNECVDGWKEQDCATAEDLGYTAEGRMNVAFHCRRTCGLCLPGKPTHGSVTFDELKEILRAYVIQWMIDAEPADHARLLANDTFAGEVLANYQEIVHYFQGRIKTFEMERQQKLSTLSTRSRGADILSSEYSFDDAHQIVGGITKTFQSFWQSECEGMKDALVSMDKHHTGRVPLSKFYNYSINNDWRFGESEAYLRELGALDETSRWLGPQVIIPNYLQATSNCIVSTPHYLICCQNECEGLLDEIELAIDAPTALPSQILDVVRSMSQITTLDEDEPPHLSDTSKQQLEQIASSSGGKVPLHGRLFAQWLHYVFPRECPFPFKSGSTSSATPAEYGDYGAAHEDMKRHASLATSHDKQLSEGKDKDELLWMSQWSEDEELMADYSSELGSSWARRCLLLLVGVLLFAGGIVSSSSDKKGSSGSLGMGIGKGRSTPDFSKAHYV